jgi:hypothetical protein
MLASRSTSSWVKLRCRPLRRPSAAHTVELLAQPMSAPTWPWVHPLAWRRVRMFAPTLAAWSRGMTSIRHRARHHRRVRGSHPTHGRHLPLARPGARRPQAAPRTAPLRAARLRLVRHLRSADAKPLGQRRTLLPVPVPRRVRARQPGSAPGERLLVRTACFGIPNGADIASRRLGIKTGQRPLPSVIKKVCPDEGRCADSLPVTSERRARWWGFRY